MLNGKMKKRIVYGFTLLELIVAMGIFSILMLMLMQFFSGAQKIWTAAEKRNAIYADARVAMDLTASMLQTTFYRTEAIPFYIKKDDPPGNGQFDSIYFVSKTGMKLYSHATSDLFMVGFFVDNTNSTPTNGKKLTLNIRMIGDDKTDSYKFFNSYDPAKLYDVLSPKKISNISNDDTDLSLPRGDEIINYVTGLTFVPYEKKGSGTGVAVAKDYSDSSAYQCVPYAIQIKLTMIDKASYEKWKLLGGKEEEIPNETKDAAKRIRLENQRSFTRMVYLGDRND